MAYKTKEEMFGDGGGFGPQVPFSTSNPPGTSAGNRGIQFGEQLTAAIANRTHYALALNTDDLNARLAAFETQGLDAAYDGGTVGPAGAGRVVVKDAGAIETQSATSTLLGDAEHDSAHFRASALGDSSPSSIGFEFRSKRMAGNGQSGDDPLAGFIDFRAYAKATGYTQLVVAQAGTLNPGGSLATTIRTGAGKFHTSSTTDLIQGRDFVEITGTASSDGLYVFSIPGSADTDAILTRIDGTSPSFTSGEACVFTVYRCRFASLGAFGSRTSHGVTVAGFDGEASALQIIPGGLGTGFSPTQEGGAYAGITVARKAATGQPQTAWQIDAFGRAKFTLARSHFFDEISKNIDGGAYATLKDHTETGSVGHVLRTSGVAVTDHPGYVEMHMIERTDLTPSFTPSITVLKFTANSPSTGEIDFNVAQDANLVHYIVPGSMIMEVLSGPTGTDGLYVIHKNNMQTTGGFLVRKLDGTVPAHFPTSGTFSGRIYAASVIGWRHTFLNPNPVDPTSVKSSIQLNNSLSAGVGDAGTALALFGADNLGTDERYLVRGFSTKDIVSSGDHREVWGVDTDGQQYLYGDMEITGPTGEFKYTTERTHHQSVVPATATFTGGFTSTGPVISASDPELAIIVTTGQFIFKGVDEVSGTLGCLWQLHLPQGAIITSLILSYGSVAGSGPVVDDIRTTICRQSGGTTLSMKTGSPNYFALTIDGAVHTSTYTMTETSGNRTVDNDTYEYYVWMGRPTGLGDYSLLVQDMKVTYTWTTVAPS